MNYSTIFAGLLATVALPLIVKSGFSEQCGNEITNWVMVSAIPGLVTIWRARVAKGDVTLLGFKK